MENKSSYRKLSPQIVKEIREDKNSGYVNPLRCDDDTVVRRNMERDGASVIRSAFVRDVEKILHLPVYNRYADKTQVFSFYKNDDITRRGLHVQIVSRIARDIGQVLGLNLDLIEAIALGHDIGHAPFGHAGERFLSELLQKNMGRYFCHNVQSVRVLDTLYLTNISLQTLDGVLCHNGEFELQEYRPTSAKSFQAFDDEVENCQKNGDKAVKKLLSFTLEGCVVRICDMIAYLGKDRQDARKATKLDIDTSFSHSGIGQTNAQIISNLTVDLIEHSYKRDYIALSEEYFTALRMAKKENYSLIYKNPEIDEVYEGTIKPMFELMFNKLLDMVIKKDQNSVIYRHHIENIDRSYAYANKKKLYSDGEPNAIVVDYIASMTDDYFIDLFGYLFTFDKYKVQYKSYFADFIDN